MKVLVTGATGYIGGRLIPILLDAGHDVRVFVRNAKRIQGKPWFAQVEVVEGDLMKLESLEIGLKDIESAYYLVHSMAAGPDFAGRDRKAAQNFVAAGKHLERVIYLGGHMPQEVKGHISKHLHSRAEVGQILREGLPVTEFRAGVIIGSGSASFEMIRYLTERLPVMITPKWVSNTAQPIGISDVLAYLSTALEKPPLGIVDIGAERLSFRQMMQGYADVRGLKRVIIPVPVLTPKLASLWIGFVTPISNSMAVPIVQGLIHTLLADTSVADEHFPGIQPKPYKETVREAIERTGQNEIETRWSDSLQGGETYELKQKQGIISEVRSVLVDADQEAVFNAFSSLGGDKGWLVWQWAWRLRGELDSLVGGPGLRRGRRHPQDLYSGEAVDCWRVEAIEKPELLRLRAEMKQPGQGWLQFEAIPEGKKTRLVQTAMFETKGFGGMAYWYSTYIFHKMIFSDMVKAIKRDAEE